MYTNPFSQKEADEVIDSFGIKDQLEEYYRNQGFLDRMIEIRTSLSSEKSARITNLTLYILSWVQGAAGLIGVLLWFLNWIVGEEPISTVSNWIELIVGILLCVVAFLIAISAEVVALAPEETRRGCAYGVEFAAAFENTARTAFRAARISVSQYILKGKAI